jgi:hypothetical protein
MLSPSCSVIRRKCFRPSPRHWSFLKLKTKIEIPHTDTLYRPSSHFMSKKSLFIISDKARARGSI